MTGRRVDVEPHLYEPGDYGRWKGRWFCQTPPAANGGSYCGDVTGHQVVEHEDGTITVAPSILITVRRGNADEECWHGYLERGVWRAV